MSVWLDPKVVNDEEAFVASFLKAGDTFVDVGANVGLLTLRAACITGREGSVTAIEAHPRTIKLLRENLALNAFDWVSVHHCAVGETEAELLMTDQHFDDQNFVVPADGAARNGVVVQVVPLDKLLPSSGEIALLKVDVEGFELAVFRGAASVLARCRAILFEVSNSHSARYGYEPRQVVDLLSKMGFRVHRLVGSRLESIDSTLPFVANGFYENLVALRA